MPANLRHLVSVPCVALVLLAGVFNAAQVQAQSQDQAQDQTQPRAATATATASNSPIARGRQGFIVNGCYECHGYNGLGSIMSGPAIAGTPIPFNLINTYIRAPTGQMPPYSLKILSEEQLRDIYAYLVSLPGPGQSTESQQSSRSPDK